MMILWLEEKAGISSIAYDTIDGRTTALKSAFRVEVQNEDGSLWDNQHNITNIDKDAHIVDGSEKEQEPGSQRNDHETYGLVEEVEVIHMEVIK